MPGALNDGKYEVWGHTIKELSMGYIHRHTYLCIFHRSSRKPIGNNEPFLPQGT